MQIENVKSATVVLNGLVRSKKKKGQLRSNISQCNIRKPKGVVFPEIDNGYYLQGM